MYINSFANDYISQCVLFLSFLYFFIEITPYFEPRNVAVKKGVNAKEVFELLTEIGR